MSRLNDGTMDRRSFVRDAALVAAGASGLTGAMGALSGLLAQPRLSGAAARRLVVPGQTRPFNMVCLGDSIMWGQGLRDSSKFTYQVQQWLTSQLPGRPVNRYVYARSGATINRDAAFDESKIEAWMNDPSLGEVPCSWPYVTQQVTVAKNHLNTQGVSADAVDLILLDGGINDVGITSILNPKFDPATIRTASSNMFTGPASPMADLLDRVRVAFPYAKIVVTGYFPIVSAESDLANLGLLLSVILAPPLLPVPILPLPAAIALTAEARDKLAALSTAWYDASNSDLAGAVAAFNARWSGTGSRAAFARVPWGPEYSYAASNSRLWLIGLPEDEVYFERRNACQAAGGSKIADARCLEAKMGHPNPAGAAVYAAACQSQIGPYLAQWKGLKMLSACVEMDPMPSPGGSTQLTVYATADGPTGRMRVPGTVRIGTQSYATDQPIPVTLCRNTTAVSIDRSGLKPTREVGPTTLSCSPITVSAAGYTDVVIRDYLKAVPLP